MRCVSFLSPAFSLTLGTLHFRADIFLCSNLPSPVLLYLSAAAKMTRDNKDKRTEISEDEAKAFVEKRLVNSSITDDFPLVGDRMMNIKNVRLALAAPPSFERGTDISNLLVLINLDLVYRRGDVRQGPSFESFQHRVGRLDRQGQVSGGKTRGFAAFHFMNTDDDEESLKTLAKQFGIKFIASKAQRDRAEKEGFGCYRLDTHYLSIGLKDGDKDLVQMVSRASSKVRVFCGSARNSYP